MPAGNHLFTVNPCSSPLYTSESESFHHYVGKLLFSCKTAIAFLSSRVKAPDVDGCKKLNWLINDLPATWDLPQTLEADAAGQAEWWIDA